jgi:hypothetical protein
MRVWGVDVSTGQMSFSGWQDGRSWSLAYRFHRVKECMTCQQYARCTRRLKCSAWLSYFNTAVVPAFHSYRAIIIEFTDCVKEKLRKNCTLATPSARYVRHLDRDGNFLQPPISFECSKFRLHHSSQGRRESSGSPSGF